MTALVARSLTPLALGLVVGFGTGCGENGALGGAAAAAPARAASRTLALVVPDTVPHQPRAVATGELKPAQSAYLAYGIPGTLARVHVRRGEAVRRGQDLATLVTASAEATVAQAEAGLAAARAQLRMAEDALSRLTPLREEQGIADAQLVQVQAQRDLAAAQVAAAEAQLQSARVHLDNHRLKAPFDGVVTLVPGGVGVSVNPGVPLFAVESTGALVLETTLPEGDAVGVKVGDAAEVSVATAGAEVRESATVRAVVPSADPMTHRVPVELAVPNTAGRFFAHSFARATLATGAERKAWSLPSGALVQEGSSFRVWTVGDGDRAEAVPVRLLAWKGGRAIVEPIAGAATTPPRLVALPPTDLAEGTPIQAATP